MKKNFENIKIKYSTLAKTKKELEDIIFMQENKVQELTSNVKKVSSIIKEKDKEIKDNKSYILNLEDTIKTLSNEFKILRNKKNKEAEKKINLLKLQINNLKKEYHNNEINDNGNISINNINNNKYPFVKYRNNAFTRGIQKQYMTSLTSEKSGNSLNTINNSSKRVKIKGRTTPFVLKKITKNIKDIPINDKKILKKKKSETPFRHVQGPTPKTTKSLSVKKDTDNNNYYVNINNKNRIMNPNSQFYNKSYKNLNLLNDNSKGNLYHNEPKKGTIINDIIMENGMSQSEITYSSGQLKKNGDNKDKDQEKNINKNESKNILLNSQIEKKDKECVDNLKLFLNKLIDDLDN
jgi:hypothetical protein